MLLIYPDPQTGEDTVVFTLRTETLSTHRGQISLPGGSQDATDPSPEFTALREAQEEIGIDPAEVTVLGRLLQVPTVVTNYLITPIVGRTARRPDFNPNPREVAALIEVPLAHLRDDAIHLTEERTASFGTFTLHSYQYGPYNIWGATGRILHVFLSDLPAFGY